MRAPAASLPLTGIANQPVIIFERRRESAGRGTDDDEELETRKPPGEGGHMSGEAGRAIVCLATTILS